MHNTAMPHEGCDQPRAVGNIESATGCLRNLIGEVNEKSQRLRLSLGSVLRGEGTERLKDMDKARLRDSQESELASTLTSMSADLRDALEVIDDILDRCEL